MTFHGIKISSSKDISIAKAEDFGLHSSKIIPKTVIVGTASFSISTEAYSQSNHNIITIDHRLGYKPFAIMYWSKGTTYSADAWVGAVSGGPSMYITWNADQNIFTIDYTYTNNFGGTPQTGLAGSNWTFKYYIFVERGNP